MEIWKGLPRLIWLQVEGSEMPALSELTVHFTIKRFF